MPNRREMPAATVAAGIGICLSLVSGCRGSTQLNAALQTQDKPAVAATQPRAAPTAAPEPPPEPVDVARIVEAGRKQVEAFFGEPFLRRYDVKVFSTRAALTDFARQRWGMPKTECWMVAMGVASTMVLLSPEAWRSEACEHRSTDEHVREIVTHELVHVFHGQHNPRPEFEGMDEAGWFVEGLAVYAAGQLDEKRTVRVQKALAEGPLCSRLADAWSGPDRYGVSGSLVRHLEQRWGRAKLRELLSATTTAQILDSLNLTEPALLESWRQSMRASGSE